MCSNYQPVTRLDRLLWHPDGRRPFTFAMLTVNATGHPLMKRFHRPEDERRMVVILRPQDYDAWLTSPVADAPRYLQRWNGPLEASPAPLPSRPPRADNGRVVIPPIPNGDLFT